jgi:integrase
VYSKRDGKKIRKTFPTLAAAKLWRADAIGENHKGTLRAPSQTTLAEASVEWLEGVEAGRIRTRSGTAYKPSAIRSYRSALEQRVLPEFGAAKLGDIRRGDLHAFVERLIGGGLSASTVHNTITPLRAIYRRAADRGDVSVNPTVDLGNLPAVKLERIEMWAPEEAAALIEALPSSDRAVWATAFYCGLRRGELQALRWEDIDIATGRIRVERAYDDKARLFIDPKSEAGRRTVPLVGILRDFLLEHRIETGRSEGLVFGATATRPFTPSNLARRAATAWKRANAERERHGEERLRGIALHKCRHTYASLMIAAGVNAKALSTYMGHSTITITLDRYGHLMPGNEDEAAELLESYLRRADTRARLAQLPNVAA